MRVEVHVQRCTHIFNIIFLSFINILDFLIIQNKIKKKSIEN